MWLVEAYRVVHGPSYAREVLTIAAGEFPDSNALMTFISFYDEGHEQMFWRDAESGEVAKGYNDPKSIESFLNEQMVDKLGTYGYDEKARLWRCFE